jgi:hypothetical protein
VNANYAMPIVKIVTTAAAQENARRAREKDKMKTIWKYSTGLRELDNTIVFAMPEGATVLSVGNQDENLYLWAEVDATAKPESRSFCVRGTGHPFTGDEGRFIGSVIFMGGSLVFHVYELKEE